MFNYPLASTTWDDKEIQAIQSVVDSGQFTMGPRVAEFERVFAAKIGSKYSVMVNSGSSANLALLSSCRFRRQPLLSPGDEVLVPAVSWSTTYYPVNQIGATLKFVDIDKHSLNLDVNKVEMAIGAKTKAILGVNLLGNPADWISLREIADSANLVLLEDNCESLGATLNDQQAGTFGLGGTFSTFFSHHISTIEGGLVVTDDESLFHTLRSIRAHGWTRDLPTKNYVHDKTGDPWEDLFRFVLPGYNLRPIEFEAAIGLVQLEKLDEFIARRRANAWKFQEIMGRMEDYRIQVENGYSSWFGFAIILCGKLKGKRRQLVDLLTTAGIESRPIVAGNFARNPVINYLDHAPISSLPVADEIHFDGLFVGNHHFDLSKELDLLGHVLEEFRKSF